MLQYIYGFLKILENKKANLVIKNVAYKGEKKIYY